MMRIVVLLVLFFFSWASIEPWKIAVAQKKEQQPNSIPARQKQDSKEQRKSFEKADRSLQNIKRIVDKLKNKAKNGEFSQRRFLSEMAAFEQEASFLESQHADIRAEFNDIHNKIQAADLPTKIMHRHQKAVSNYNANYNKLKKYVDYIKQYKNNASQTANQSSINYEELKRNIEDMSAFLDENVKGKPHNPLNPNKLPHRPAEKVEPSVETMSKRDLEKFKNEHDPVLLAYNGDPANLQLAQVPSDLPTEEDLAENIEVQFTEGITSLAASLDNHPLNIFNWVRQNIRFVPTFGSIQGAEACRLSKECNAHDAASLLIALLRVSGVPARYVAGTIQIDADLFKSALGDFEDIRAAARLASSGGLTVTLLNDPSTGEVAAVKMNHVWVEAFVDYVPSRGAVKGEGDTWVPLDVVIKRMEFNAPIDVQSVLGVNNQTVSNLLNTGTIGSNGNSIFGVSEPQIDNLLSSSIENLNSFIDTNLPDATVGEIIGALEIEVETLSILPASLSGRIISTEAKNSELPSSIRDEITIRIEDEFGEGISFATSTPEIATKRITIGHIPDTQADVDTIESFGGLLNTPPHLVSLSPVIYLEGNPIVTSGKAFKMGTILDVSVNFNQPGGGKDSVLHKLSSGSYAAIGLNHQSVSDDLLTERRAKLEVTNELFGEEDLNFDEIIGEILNIHALTFFSMVDLSDRLASHQLNIVFYKRVSELLLSFDLQFSSLFGVPHELSNTNMSIDLQRRVIGLSSRVGDSNAELDYLFSTDSFGSGMEHGVFENFQNVEAVSAVRLIREANNQGIPVFSINSSNINEIMPLLSLDSEVISDIQNSVSAGNQVLAPQSNLSVVNYDGVGYIVINPTTGAGAYLISGGLAGGENADTSLLVEVLAQIINGLSYSIASSEAIGRALSLLGNAETYLVAIGTKLAIVGGFLSFINSFNSTGNDWKALSQTTIDIFLGFSANYIIGALVASGPVTISVILGVITITALFIAMMTALDTAIMQTLIRNIRRRYNQA